MTEFTVQVIVDALAKKLGEHFPGTTVYANPNQQGTALPAFFITFMPTSVKQQMGNRWLRELGVDLTYLVAFDLPDLGDRYLAAAEVLDEVLELFPLPDGLPLRTYERKWFVELDALHYQFKTMARASLPVREVPMQAIERVSEEVIV